MGCCGGKNEEEEEFGKKRSHDPDFRGIVRNRSCTDVICCIILFVYILGYMTVAIFAWLNGNPIILFYPTDSEGRICGIKYNDLDLSNKTSLYYFDISKCAAALAMLKFQCPTRQVCVPECPTTYWTYAEEVAKISALELASVGSTPTRTEKAAVVDWSKFICTYGYDPLEAYRDDNVSLDEMMLQEKCVPYYVPSEPVAGRCIPMVSEAAGALNSTGTAIQNADGQNLTSTDLVAGVEPIKYFLEAKSIANKIFADLTVVWQWILLLLCVSALVAFLWIVVLRWVAGPMVWLTLLLFVVVSSVGVYIAYLQWTELKNAADSGTEQPISNIFQSTLSTYFTMQTLWLVLLIVFAIIDFIVIVTIIFLRDRIRIAIGIIHQASKAISAMMTTLFYPLVTFILVLVVIGFWTMTALFLASTGDPIYKYSDMRVITNSSAAASDQNLTGVACNVTEFNNNASLSSQNGLLCEFIEYGGDSVFHQNVVWLQVAEFFGMLWFLNWVLALGQMTLAGAFSSWYWAFKKPRDVPVFAVFQSFGRALRYHTGTLAFGSFLVAVVQLIRVFLEYVDRKLKNKENKVAKFILCCLKCCFWCLEKFLKFINRNAYIMTAIYGKNFCWSAHEAFKLLMRNILRVIILDKMVDYIFFIGKLVVCAIMGVLGWLTFSGYLSFLPVPALHYYWMPIVIIVLATFMIASGFFNTFGMAADTIFLCFLEDLERNDGTEEKPYFMAKSLLKVLGKKNDSERAKKKKAK